jgi:HAD superfamily hydrolase (TIGR01509 family)
MKPLRIEESFDLLICDCDGVIIDSEIVCERILAAALDEAYRGRDLAPALAGSFGLQLTDILERVAAHLKEPLPEGFLERVDREMVAALHREAAAIDGVREALELIGLPVAIASNSSQAWIELSLARAGLAQLIGPAIFSADRVLRPKPAPDVYLLAAREMGVAPARCLVVEDSRSGVTAALAAGMSVIGFLGASHVPLRHGEDLLKLGARMLVEHMEALPRAVAELQEARRGGLAVGS